MATNNLLQESAPAYSKFVDNQVLTNDQLNAVVDHLNYQDKLSRVLLSGVGIVCGLKISLENENSVIRLTKGAAVTTDGDLLKLEETVFTGFSQFGDSNVKYPRFAIDEETTIDLWELETSTEPSDVEPLGEFESASGLSLESAVAVLYLESYLKDPEDCSPVDCDTQGQEAVNKPRVLLVSPEHAEHISEQDSIFSALLNNSQNPVLDQLTPLYTKRVVLNTGNTASYSNFKKAYRVFFNELAGRVNILKNISLLKETYEQIDVEAGAELDNINISFHNVQYTYDLYRDLTEAYNELRQLLTDKYALCCPDAESFPKHILLGSLTGTPGPWRHRFYPSPILNYPSGTDRIQKAFRRLLLLIKNYRTRTKQQIIITPSMPEEEAMGRRAIPYYYDLESSENTAALFNSWKEEAVEFLPNYYGYNYPGNDFDPLDIELKGHNFYRIEGHVGHHISDAHERLEAIKKEKGLAFNIMPIAIGGNPDEETINYEDYKVHFEDLQVVLQAWNEEQQCLMKSASSFLSKFSISEAGTHLNYVSAESTSDTSSSSASSLSSGIITHMAAKQPMYYAMPTYEAKAKTNYVLEGIGTDENSLGSAMIKEIDTSDNKNDIWVKTHAVLDNIIQDWDPDLVEATINIPGQLIGYLKETEDNKLTNIEDFTEENLQKYIKSLESQCQKTKASKKRLQSLINKDGSVLRSQDWIENYLYILNRITSACCLIEKVKVLYEKILERKKEVLEQLALENFIDTHPGAEHHAGVPEGGTFVLLYYSDNRRQASVSSSALSLLTGRSETGFLRANINVPRIANIAALSHGIRRYERIENIPHGTVIGDLCLPYVCCSNTPSNTFIFPDQPAILRLPVDHVCVEADQQADHVLLEVTPLGGTVKAFIGERELDGVIIHNDNGTFFNPNEVAEDDYSKSIRFTVDDQVVNPVLSVHEKPNPVIEVVDQIGFRNNNTIAVVTFSNESSPFEGISFDWNFGDDSSETQNALRFTHEYNVKPGTTFEFEVTLTATNGPCEASTSETVTIEVPAIEEPEDDCPAITEQAVKASVQAMEKELRDHPDLLAELQSFYSDKVNPVYKQILNDMDGALNGDMDNEVFGFIQNTQFFVQNSIPGFESVEEREFALKLYYETMLLYFYLQACRDESIVVHDAISDVVPSWESFTDQATSEFKNALIALLREDKIHEKLGRIHSQVKDRLSENLSSIIEKILEMMREFLGL